MTLAEHSDAKPSWVVVMTKPNCEDMVERGLRRAGRRVYFPRSRKLIHPKGFDRRGEWVLRPVFLGYGFGQHWTGWPKESIDGVIGLMRVGSRLATISDQDVHRLLGKEWRGEFDDPEPNSRRPDLEIGDQVSFERAGNRILATIEDLEDNGKAIIRTMLFGGREVRTGVAQNELTLVSA